MTTTRTTRTGQKLEIRQIRERDDDCYRYSAQRMDTGEFLVSCALSEDYDADLEEALAKL